MSLISRDDMTQLRSPADQRQYALERWQAIYDDKVERQQARINSGDYKEYLEEYLPFSAICVEYFNFTEDCRCGLSEIKSGNHDAIVHLSDNSPHIFEFTQVIDGKSENMEMKQLNSDGHVFNVLGDYDDIEIQTAILEKALATATKKTLKTYQSKNGPSTLVIQIDCNEFYDDNPYHSAVMTDMIAQLKKLKYRVDNVVLMKLNFFENNNVYEYMKLK